MTATPPASKQNATLFAFLRHYHPKVPRELVALLPEAEQNDLTGSQLRPDGLIVSLSEVIEQIHYSWVVKVIAGDPEEMYPLWCGALPVAGVAGVARQLQIGEPYPILAETVVQFLLQTLYQRLGLAQVLPVAMLPPSEMNQLLNLDKRQLVNLVDHMGIRDLASILRRIVLPEMQQQVRDLLTPTQRILLERALQSQDLMPPPELDLQHWLVNARELHRFIQVRGLTRLGKALTGGPPTLVWHVARRLDTGRGKLLMDYSQQQLEPIVEKRLGDELNSLLMELRPKDNK